MSKSKVKTLLKFRNTDIDEVIAELRKTFAGQISGIATPHGDIILKLSSDVELTDVETAAVEKVIAKVRPKLKLSKKEVIHR